MGRGQYDRAAARAKRNYVQATSVETISLGVAAGQEAAGLASPWAGEMQMRKDQTYTVTPAELANAEYLRRVAVGTSFERPSFPYENTVKIGAQVLNPHGQPVTQADYDALVAKYDRLLRLCQTHGLMI